MLFIRTPPIPCPNTYFTLYIYIYLPPVSEVTAPPRWGVCVFFQLKMVTQDKEEDRKDFVHLNAEIKYPVSNIQVGRRCRDTCGFQRKLFAYWGITHRLVRAGFKSVNARFLRLSGATDRRPKQNSDSFKGILQLRVTAVVQELWQFIASVLTLKKVQWRRWLREHPPGRRERKQK